MTAAVAPLLAMASLLWAATPALAHPPPLGFTGFPGGLLHPLFVPAHVLAVTGLGILIGQQRPRWGIAAPLGYVAALAIGLGALTLAVVPRYSGEAVLMSAFVVGGLAAWARRLPEPIGCALAAAIGLSIALDSPPQVISIAEANLMLLGTGLGAAAFLVVVTACASRFRRGWHRIGLRVLGSWIAASAILVLALQWAR
jgi:urease accessory protein